MQKPNEGTTRLPGRGPETWYDRQHIEEREKNKKVTRYKYKKDGH